MFRVALRQQLVGVVGMAFFAIVGGSVQAAAFSAAAGTTAAAHQAFAQQMSALGRQISYLLPIPVGVDTIGGYLQWRAYGGYAIVILIWVTLSASGAIRGDEERGLVEAWIAGGISRFRYVVTRFAAFTVAAAVFASAMAGAVYLGSTAAGFSLDLAGLLEASVAMIGLALACYAVVLVISEVLATRAAAAGLGGGLLLAMFFVNSFSRTVDSLRPIARQVSPFYLYDLDTPLAAGRNFDAAATAVLFGVAGLLTVLAAALMHRRDLGAALLRGRGRSQRPVYRSDPNPLLRLPVLASLYERRWGLLAWTVGSATAAAFFASLGRQLVDVATSTRGGFQVYLALVGNHDPYVTLTGYFWFGFFQLLLAVYTITQVARWAADDNEGRLEMELSGPVPRRRVVIERALTLLASLTVVVGVAAAAFYMEAHAINIDVRPGDLAVASVLLLPFATTFAAVGALLVTRLPRATVAVLVTIAGLSYLEIQVGPLLRWPDWALRLSIFTLYGSPLTDGVRWDGLVEMLAICAVGFGFATLLMQRREVGR